MGGYHSKLTTDQLHAIHAFQYANASLRTSATGFVSTDVYKIALQTDNNTYWVLTSTTPTWSPISVSSLLKYDREQITNGSDTVEVTFSAAFEDTNYTLCYEIENTTDSPPAIFMSAITSKAAGGFTITLSGAADTDNYYLNWIAIHD